MTQPALAQPQLLSDRRSQVVDILEDDPLFTVHPEYVQLKAPLLASVALHAASSVEPSSSTTDGCCCRWPPEDPSIMPISAFHSHVKRTMASILQVMRGPDDSAACARNALVTDIIRSIASFGVHYDDTTNARSALHTLRDLARRDASRSTPPPEFMRLAWRRELLMQGSTTATGVQTRSPPPPPPPPQSPPGGDGGHGKNGGVGGVVSRERFR